MATEFRVGIAGFGGAGLAQYEHFNALGCKVTSIYDPKTRGLDRARALSTSLYVSDDFESFLRSDIHVVAVCSPDAAHADHVVRSLEAGKHVLCEKPLTDSLEGCRRILNAEREATGLVVAVQHQMRFVPVHRKMHSLLRAGALGPVSYAEGYYVHNLVERSRLYDTWRFDDAAHPLVYAGCHFVDLLRWLLQDEVVEVEGMANSIAFPEYPHCDLCVVLLRFRSGVVGKVVVAFGVGRPQDHSVRVYGREGTIENNLLFDLNGFKVFARPLLRHRDRSLLRNVRLNGRPFLLGLLFKALMSLHRRRDFYAINSFPLRLYEHTHAVYASVADFLLAVKARGRPLCSALEAAKTVATCIAGVEALETGKRVSVAPYWLPWFDE